MVPAVYQQGLCCSCHGQQLLAEPLFIFPPPPPPTDPFIFSSERGTNKQQIGFSLGVNLHYLERHDAMAPLFPFSGAAASVRKRGMQRLW